MKTAKSFWALLVFCCLPLAAVAAEAVPTETGHHALSLRAVDVVKIHEFVITNSMIVTWIVALGLIAGVQIATRHMKAVPAGAQNFWEWVVESLYEFLESVIGPALVKKTFWLFATIFIFVLASSWFSLLPGVGSIGWGVHHAEGFQLTRPLFRGSTADLNMTLAIAMVFFFYWIVWAWQSQGPVGVVLHIFGPKGDSTGPTQVLLIVVFIAVGFLEIISIMFRPISLSLRLFGNMYAGEDMLEIMTNMVPALSWLLPLPIYFMEILVGFVQALVFMLLTAVFTLLICQHDEHPASTSH